MELTPPLPELQNKGSHLPSSEWTSPFHASLSGIVVNLLLSISIHLTLHSIECRNCLPEILEPICVRLVNQARLSSLLVNRLWNKVLQGPSGTLSRAMTRIHGAGSSNQLATRGLHTHIMARTRTRVTLASKYKSESFGYDNFKSMDISFSTLLSMTAGPLVSSSLV